MSGSPFDQENDSWYLIHCQARKEQYVENILKNVFGFSVYCPFYQTWIGGQKQSLPFFPGYLFVQMNLHLFPLSRINACPGVLRVVEFDDRPFPVPRYVLDEIVERLERMNMLDQPFQPGDVVRLKHDGPLQDLEMVFLGPMTPGQRVDVLLRFLGRSKRVRVDIDTLEKVSSHPLPEEPLIARHTGRKRLTRGRGRKINILAGGEK